MDLSAIPYIISVVKSLRDRDIACEIYPDSTKLKKQFDYADKNSIRFISIIGEDEVEKNIINIKNLATGEQQSFAKKDIEAIISFITDAQK